MKFKVDGAELLKAFKTINYIAKIKSNVNSVIMLVESNVLKLKFSNGEQSALYNLRIRNRSKESIEVVVSLEIINILERLQSISYIISDALEITLQDHQMNICSVKRYNEEHELSGKEVSNMTYSVSVSDTSDIRYSILNRCDYESFKSEDLSYDSWDKSTLQDILKISSFEKTALYFSKSLMKVFTITNTYVYTKELPNLDQKGFVLDYNSTNGLNSIIKLLNKEKYSISFNSDKKQITLMVDDNNTIIKLLSVQPVQIDMDAASLYIDKINFESCRMLVNKLVLVNSIDTLLMMDKADKHIIKLDKDSNGNYLGFNTDKGSSKNDIKVYIQSIEDTADLVGKKFKGSVFLNYIKNNLDTFKGQWVKLSFEKMTVINSEEFCLKLEDVLNDKTVSTVYTRCVEV